MKGMMSPILYRMLGRFARFGQMLYDAFHLDQGWIRTPLDGWTRSRALPRLAPRTFHDWWKQENAK